ncbi:MAG: N-acetylmuramoyl-L-alanine amidase [Clostridia bacterium]|nr:N-acetylmuramoyl-L-alanine amidase [Clostridia bacterium]
MKRIKNRRKHFRIANPLGFSLFCAMIILAVGLIVGTVFLIRGGYLRDMLNCARSELNGRGASPTQIAEVSEAPETPAPSVKPTDSDLETPAIGTPVPETPTPPPIEPETPDPNAAAGPTKDPTSPLAGFTIGLDPTRDGGSKYKEEGEYNLEFAKELAAFLESKGATVVITREDTKKEVGNSQRAKIIKNANCDIALRLMCNHISSKTSGCYVQAPKKHKSYGKALIDLYSDATGIRIQSGKKNGVEQKNDEVASACGCPCVLLIMGNWDNKTERANLRDEATRQKMMQAICDALVGQLKK